MKQTIYDPNALYRCLSPIRRTANCVQGQPKNATGNIYILPPDKDDNGNELERPILFTMADREPATIKRLVESMRVIALAEEEKK